ncbi:dTMP kinase [Patescibacteria group bacterium]
MSAKNFGKFITLYSGNNLGKTTQVKAIKQQLQKKNIKVEIVKYAIYDLDPTGILINQYLRENNPYKLDSTAFQTLQAANRYQYEPTIKEKLSKGIWILAEDYIGTSIVWGIATGVEKDYLVKLNSGLLKPDLEIVLVGKPFDTGHEKNHTHEDNRKLVEQVSSLHEKLALELNWVQVNANQKIPEVTKDLMAIILDKFAI